MYLDVFQKYRFMVNGEGTLERTSDIHVHFSDCVITPTTRITYSLKKIYNSLFVDDEALKHVEVRSCGF